MMAISHLHSNWRLLYQPANQPAQQNNPATRSTAISPTHFFRSEIWRFERCCIWSLLLPEEPHIFISYPISLFVPWTGGESQIPPPPPQPIENTNLGLQRGKVLLHFPFSNLSNEPVTIAVRPSEAPLLHTSPSSPWERLRPCETTWLWKGL